MRGGRCIQQVGLRSCVPLRNLMLVTLTWQLRRQRIRTSRAIALRFGIKHRRDVRSLQVRLLRHPVIKRSAALKPHLQLFRRERYAASDRVQLIG